MRAASKSVKLHSLARRIFEGITTLAHFEFFLCGTRRGMLNTAYSVPREENPNCTQTRNTFLGLNGGGFTIVETLIVLAVTGVLFLVAVLAVGGKQNETEFQQGINDANSSMQQVISQVQAGNYQAAKNLSCNASAGSIIITASGGSTNTEGTSHDCVFVGKVVQFMNGSGGKNKQFITYPIAGIRAGSTGNLCTTIACSNPIIVGPDNGPTPLVTGPSNNFPDDGLPTTLHYGLSVASIKTFVNGAEDTSTTFGGFAIMASLGVTTGSSQYYLVPMRGTTFGYNPYNPTARQTDVSWQNKNLQWSYSSALALINSDSNYRVEICLASGTTKESGKITIGGNGGDLNSVTTTIYSNKTCAP